MICSMPHILIAALFLNLPYSKKLTQFSETGTIKNQSCSEKAKFATNDDKNMDVLQLFQKNTHLSMSSTSTAMQAHDIMKAAFLKF